LGRLKVAKDPRIQGVKISRDLQPKILSY